MNRIRLTREEAIMFIEQMEKMANKALEQEPCDVFDEYGNYKYPSDVELTEPNTATSMPCEDAISRQAVLDLMRSLPKWYVRSKDGKYNNVGLLYDDVMFGIDNLPPVNPQPKTGHWITTRTFMHDGEYYCDKCRCDAPNNEKWDYCPNCGARMEEQK